MADEHKWTENDDKVAFYLYQFGGGVSSNELEPWCRLLDITPVSMKMRIGNFKTLDGSGGLENFALQSEKIYKLYKDIPESKLREELLTIAENILFDK